MLMVFLATAFIVILPSVFFIYKFLSVFQIQVELKALFMSAIMSFILLFTACFITSYVTISYYAIIFVIVVLTTLFTAFYNNKLLLARSAVQIEQINKPLQEKPSPIVKQIPVKIYSAPKIIKKVSYQKKSYCLPTKPINLLKTTIDYLPTNWQNLANHSKHTYETVKFSKHQQKSNNLKNVQIAAHIMALPIIEKSNFCKRLPAYNYSTNPNKTTLPVPLGKFEIQCSKLYLLTRSKKNIVRHLKKIHSIDELLNYVYEQNRKNQYASSLYALKCSLPRYRKNAYAPFICIEMSNIYKNFGALNKAIFVLVAALYLPAVADNKSILQKLREQINYLHKLDHILLLHNMNGIPFTDIPKEYLKQAERI